MVVVVVGIILLCPHYYKLNIQGSVSFVVYLSYAFIVLPLNLLAEHKEDV